MAAIGSDSLGSYIPILMPASGTAYLYMTRAHKGEHNTEHKCIKPKGRKDQDIVIDLVTDVNNIVLRLKALNIEQMLIVDSDFMSAIYRVLPSPSQEKWLEFNKEMHNSKWEAFMKFLDQGQGLAV